MAKKYALIWWVKTQEKDVVDLAIIPKKQRIINNIIKLPWKDGKTKKQICLETKILKISSDEKELNKTIVTNEGELHDMRERIMSSDILNEEKQISQGQKIGKNVSRSRKNKLEEQIKKTKTILETLTQESEQPKINFPKHTTESPAFNYSSQYIPSANHSTSYPSSRSPYFQTNSNSAQSTTVNMTENVSQHQYSENLPAVSNLFPYSQASVVIPESQDVQQISQGQKSAEDLSRFRKRKRELNQQSDEPKIKFPKHTTESPAFNYSSQYIPSANHSTSYPSSRSPYFQTNSNSPHSTTVNMTENVSQHQYSENLPAVSNLFPYSQASVVIPESQDHHNSSYATTSDSEEGTTITLPFKVTKSFVGFIKTLHDCFTSVLQENKVEEDDALREIESFKKK
ncbi:uncharacterized protein LOC129915421 isoform X2 [Episyrphus balteatus]|uniref:uncharacterized protein LOC129915420 isoform X2 n=1 Tax=Episyrphus balteatus TaxID=286459 RepID=UPI002486CA05|nr:uncharacterized protein LOC129915420 isoform X2 [Episyrphus balteatus]XP_055850922.1 uncharacterized protein LOC129915421 isoform X2 [Episyrphus balteatus]